MNPEKKAAYDKVYKAANADRIKKYNKSWRDAHRPEIKAYNDSHRERGRVQRYKKSFGITVEKYDAMLLAQGGVCAICLRPPKRNRLGVDHHHKSGQVRQLLCWSCNWTLGRWGEDANRFERAAAYLRKHEEARNVQEQAKNDGHTSAGKSSRGGKKTYSGNKHAV